jgi:hypothetical protein
MNFPGSERPVPANSLDANGRLLGGRRNRLGTLPALLAKISCLRAQHGGRLDAGGQGAASVAGCAARCSRPNITTLATLRYSYCEPSDALDRRSASVHNLAITGEADVALMLTRRSL